MIIAVKQLDVVTTHQTNNGDQGSTVRQSPTKRHRSLPGSTSRLGGKKPTFELDAQTQRKVDALFPAPQKINRPDGTKTTLDVKERVFDYIDRDMQQGALVQASINWLSAKVVNPANGASVRDSFLSAVALAVPLIEIDCAHLVYHRATHALEFGDDLTASYDASVMRPVLAIGQQGGQEGVDSHRLVKAMTILMAIFHDVVQKYGPPYNEEYSYEKFASMFVDGVCDRLQAPSKVRKGLRYFAERAIVTGTCLALNWGPEKTHKSWAILIAETKLIINQAALNQGRVSDEDGVLRGDFVPFFPYLDAVLAMSKFDVARSVDVNAVKAYKAMIHQLVRRHHVRLSGLELFIRTGQITKKDGRKPDGKIKIVMLPLEQATSELSEAKQIARASAAIVGGQILRMLAEQGFQWHAYENGTHSRFVELWRGFRMLVLNERQQSLGTPSSQTSGATLDTLLKTTFKKGDEDVPLYKIVAEHVLGDFGGFWARVDVYEASRVLNQAVEQMYELNSGSPREGNVPQAVDCLGQELPDFRDTIGHILQSVVDRSKFQAAKLFMIASVMQSGARHMKRDGTFDPAHVRKHADKLLEGLLK